MKIPTITNYRVEEVEVPAPKDEQQIIREVLGLAAPPCHLARRAKC